MRLAYRSATVSPCCRRRRVVWRNRDSPFEIQTMADRDPLKLLEILGVWAGAIATFCAVVVSLRLARRAERPQMKVGIDERIIVDPGAAHDRSNIRLEDFPEVIVLSATNTGLTRVRVNSVGWHWFLIRDIGALQNPPDQRSHSNWPTVLEHGDEMQWVLDLGLLVPKLAKDMLARSWWWRLKLELLCVIVGTSTGHRFRARLGPTLKKTFAAQVRNMRSSDSRENDVTEQTELENDHWLETYKSLITLSIEGFRFAALANGGAAVALLAYLGNVAGKGGMPDMRCPMAWFLAGLCACALAMACGYLTQLRLLNERAYSRPRHKWPLWAAILAFVASFTCFAVGAWQAVTHFPIP